MRGFLALCLSLAFFLTACSGTDTVIKKPWSKHRNTVYIEDLTLKKDASRYAGHQLRVALEDQFTSTLFIVVEDKEHAKYLIKYKVTEFNQGSRLKRFFTFGIDDGSHATMTVKIGLLGEQGTLGKWKVSTWVNGGITGGSEDDLYEQAAEQIL